MKMNLFTRHSDVEIIVGEDADEAIRLAAADLQSNLRGLSGQKAGFPIVEKSTSAGVIRICTAADNTPEAYTVSIDDESVLITGSDTLGTVFGIYAFATKCLKILPVYRLVNLFPEEREELCLEPQTFSSQPRTIRFRGWFLNDEDLLTDFRESGGHRNIDYPFYQNVMDTDLLDMILETALRMEMNLVIPSSFVDIDNPDEEKLVKTVIRRGMYITQHHVEPMGVSWFAADAYMKKYGKSGEVSFIRNRECMEEIWRYYAGKWAVYGRQVIWQLGLRGKADNSVWKTDKNVPENAVVRGAIITDAISTQHRIIEEVLGSTDFHSSTTLWMEGAELYGKGYLQIPNDTVVVFSDIGNSQMFGDDFYQVVRKPSQRYGIYYHVGFWSQGPHLAEGCDLRKMVYSYREAWEQKSLYYSILNVSNVRPLHFSMWYNAQLLKNPKDFPAEKVFDEQLKALFGDAYLKVKPLMAEYYDSFADLGKAELKDRCNFYEFYFHEYGKLPFPEFPATDGCMRCAGRNILNGTGYTVDDGYFVKVLQESLNKFEALYGRMQETEQTLPDSCRLYFSQFLKYETFYMMQMTRWVLYCREFMKTDDSAERDKAAGEAVQALTAILEERKILELGDWKGWHRGDKKVNVSGLLELTKQRYQEKSKG